MSDTTTQRDYQSLTAKPESPWRVPYKVGEALPMHMDVIAMCRAFGGISPRQFHRRAKTGEFRRFEIPGSHPKAWSGTRVARHLTGDSFAIAVRRSA